MVRDVNFFTLLSSSPILSDLVFRTTLSLKGPITIILVINRTNLRFVLLLNMLLVVARKLSIVLLLYMIIVIDIATRITILYYLFVEFKF